LNKDAKRAEGFAKAHFAGERSGERSETGSWGPAITSRTALRADGQLRRLPDLRSA